MSVFIDQTLMTHKAGSASFIVAEACRSEVQKMVESHEAR